ncbi:MAG: MBL fold metallo-hydrolase [Candidatus Portnoybacteria bacterium]|nr:MBL fold metallo-hydrolase [Candidatus Portnoybacteria bacterium]
MKIKRLIVGPVITNCYILSSNNDLAIIDPGGDPDLILSELEKLDGKLKYIINTHYHFDHILGNRKIRKETKAKILIHENEKEFIDFDADKYLKDGDIIGIGDEELEVIHTPGHTRGDICLLGNNLIFTGDILFKEGYGRTDLPGGSDDQIKKSIKKIKSLIKPSMKVLPGHGDVFVA